VSVDVQDDRSRSLADGLRGEFLTPGSDAYDTARRVFNGMVDRRPAAIVRPRGTSDVLRAVAYARERDLPVAVRGGGHNVAGHGTCDGGLLIDFSLMRSVRVDVVSQTARADPGCTWTDFDAETTAHGLATTGGTVGSTGIAGLTLGGGVGFLMGRYGLTCDNIVSVDVVTAEATAITASERDHPDLFWGIRGGGGNFGVVTSFEYRLHPVDTLLAGLALYHIGDARASLELFREVCSAAPDELTCAFAMITLPDGGPPVAAIAACYDGPVDEGEAVVAPLRRLGPPLDDGIRPMGYTDVQRIFAEIPFGLQNYWKGTFLREMTDDVITATVDAFAEVTSNHSAILIEAPHGAVARVPDDATAFGQRQARFNASALAIWESPADRDRNIDWARRYADALAPASSGGYVNYLGDDASTTDVAAAYGQSRYERLVAVKDVYDPTNMFRFNQNVIPSARP
jgi:FAD/FMN-containing dehydrogenase